MDEDDFDGEAGRATGVAIDVVSWSLFKYVKKTRQLVPL